MRFQLRNVVILIAAFVFTPFAWVVLFSNTGEFVSYTKLSRYSSSSVPKKANQSWWYTETSAHGGLGPETSAQAAGDLGPN